MRVYSLIGLQGAWMLRGGGVHFEIFYAAIKRIPDH